MQELTEIVQKGKYLYGHFLNSTIKDGIDRYETNVPYSNGNRISGSGSKVLIIVVVIVICIAAYFAYKYFKNKKDKKEEK